MEILETRSRSIRHRFEAIIEYECTSRVPSVHHKLSNISMVYCRGMDTGVCCGGFKIALLIPSIDCTTAGLVIPEKDFLPGFLD